MFPPLSRKLNSSFKPHIFPSISTNTIYKLKGQFRKILLFQGDTTLEIPMINVPGQRFTATHGIKAKKGEHKLFM